MNLAKHEWHISIIAKIFIIMILLFICYRIVIYDARINELTAHVYNLSETVEFNLTQGAPIHMGQGSAAIPTGAERTITVHVAGAVANPGVFVLPEGSRVVDLIEAAGGEHENVDISSINLAARVEDAMHIRIPFIDDDEDDDFELTPVVVGGG